MKDAILRIVETRVADRDGLRYWPVTWENDEPIRSLYLEDTYLERIAPRLRESWTLEEVYDLG